LQEFLLCFSLGRASVATPAKLTCSIFGPVR
jgi:hypothetical protein